MNTLKLFAVIVAVAVSSVAVSQKIKVKGDLDPIKQYDKVQVVFDYSEMSVGKYKEEKNYVDYKVAELNEDEPGKGDKWIQGWRDNREAKYEPKFEELINEYVEKVGLSAYKSLEDAPVKMVIKTYHTEPGFNVGVMRKDAHIHVKVHFVEKGSDNEFATMDIKNVPGRGGMGYDFDAAFRIQEAYAKLGKEVGKYLVKKVY